MQLVLVETWTAFAHRATLETLHKSTVLPLHYFAVTAENYSARVARHAHCDSVLYILQANTRVTVLIFPPGTALAVKYDTRLSTGKAQNQRQHTMRHNSN